MRLFVALCFFLYTQLSQAAPSSLSSTEHKRSHSSLLSEIASRSPTNNKCGSHISLSWYVSWHSGDFPLSAVPWSKYTSVIYSFATTTPDIHTIGLSQEDQQLLPQFVQAAKQHHVNAILAIGGWGPGSQYFSSAVATEANRTAFAQAIMATVKKYNLDGIDFDWEFPGHQSIGCKTVSSFGDTANFLLFLETLRNQQGAKNLILSAAVGGPFIGSDGNPSRDVSGFAKVLDYIELMNYEIWGSWSPSVGPNAPLDDSCAPSPQGSAKSGVKAWTQAGFPVHKIVLGVPSFGHSYHVDPSNAYDASGKLKPYVPFDKNLQPAGDKWDAKAGGVDQCGNKILAGGVFQFWGLIDGGFLNKNGKAANGIDYTFDQCSQTPFVYNRQSKVMVSYDNAASFAAKGKYIKSAGLAGFAMWEAGGDSHNILLKAINSAVGNTC